MSSKIDSVHYLDKNTARLITSNQVIQGPYNAVKELVENALDAKATAIDVRLDNFGLDKVEVKDNGKGISRADVPLMCLPGHSSKIKSFSDLNDLTTYGFRGEALAALCCVANVTITTKTKESSVASMYNLDSAGNILECKPSPLSQGTLVSVSQLFCHQPARRRMLVSGKGGAALGASKSATLSQVRTLLGALGVAWPEVRFSLIHNGSLVWRKQAVPTSSQNPLQVALGEYLGHAQVANLVLLSATSEAWGEVKILIPRLGCKVKEICQSTKAGMFIVVNKRIVHHKKIESTLLQHFRAYFSDLSRNKYPACVVEVTLNPQDLDVNLEPDKSKILVNAEKEATLLQELSSLIANFYSESLIESDSQKSCVLDEPSKKKTKVDELCETELVVISPDAGVQPTSSYFSSGEEPPSKKARIDESATEETETVLPPLAFKIKPATTIPGLCIEILEASEPEVDMAVIKCETEEVASISDEQVGTKSLEESQPSSVNSPVLSSSFDLSLFGDKPQSSQESSTDLDMSAELTEDDRNALVELEKLYLSSNKEPLNDESLPKSSGDVCPISPSPTTDNFGEAWSRGQLETKGGKSIQGCSVLVPKPAPFLSVTLDIETAASPSSQMGCRELAGFSLFCKEMRPKIIQESPGIAFTAVAQILARSWKELPSVEKERYGELSKQFKHAKRFGETSRTNSIPVAKSPMTTNAKKKSVAGGSNKKNDVSPGLGKKLTVTSVSLVSKSSPLTPITDATPGDQQSKSPEQKGKPSKKANRPKKEVLIDFSLDDIEHLKLSSQATVVVHKTVGRVMNCWLLKRGEELGLLRHWALRETLLHQRLLAEMVLPVAPLDTPLEITSRDIGWKAWQALSSLEFRWDLMTNQTEVCSSLVTSNGFRVVVNKSEDGMELTSAQVTHVTTAISEYGVHELEELLLMLNKTPNCNLAQSRPQAVVQYLKNQALEASKSASEAASAAEIDELMEQWDRFKMEDWHCLHQREIFKKLHTIC